MRWIQINFPTLALVLLPAFLCHGQGTGDNADIKKIKDFLSKKYPGKKWQIGPTRLTSPALDKVYGKTKFYYVYSPMPLPPGAFNSKLIEAYKERMADYLKNYLSLTMAFDDKGSIRILKSVEDILPKPQDLKTNDDTRIATAAVLSLVHNPRVPPGKIDPDDVRVVRQQGKWVGVINRPNQYLGTAVFSERGLLEKVSKEFRGPLPP